MTINYNERVGIVFTIAFVGIMLILTQLLSSKFSTDNRITILTTSIIIFAVFGIISFKKRIVKPNTNITMRSYLTMYIIGMVLGISTHVGIETAYSVDYQNAEPSSIFYGILLAFGSLFGFYFFSAMSMVISIFHIPIIKRKYQNNSWWFSFIGGITFGFGIKGFYQLIAYGIPKFWFLLQMFG